ncbi:MAG: phytoene/squalene synthase family protein [Pseudomonadota bacterium]
MMTDKTPDLSYCADYVRRHDRDRFLCALFARPERREDLFVLYAFHQEISKTREMVSEAMLGHIRLQWWRDTLSGIEQGDVRKHEVVEPLAALITSGRVARKDLEAVIDAREFDLADTAPESIPALEQYVDQTSGHLAAMAAGVLGATNVEAKDAARRAGLAYGMVGILRAMVFHGRAKRLYMPQDRIAEHKVAQGDLFEFRGTEPVRALVRELAETAQSHIKAARKMRRDLPKMALPAALPLVLAEGYLKKLEKSGFDPFSAEFGLARPASFMLTLRGIIGRL